MTVCDWQYIGSRVKPCDDIFYDDNEFTLLMIFLMIMLFTMSMMFMMIMMMFWWLTSCMLTLCMIMHAFISELGKTLVQWWHGSKRDYDDLVQRRTMVVSCPERDTISRPKTGTTCIFDEEVGGISICIII